jgi:hypothetical protein
MKVEKKKKTESFYILGYYLLGTHHKKIDDAEKIYIKKFF